MATKKKNGEPAAKPAKEAGAAKKPDQVGKPAPAKKEAAEKKTEAAKKPATAKKPETARKTDLSLPQNITVFGTPGQEDKKIYISQRVYKVIHRFTEDKTTDESGGVLLGNVVEEFGKTHIIIRAFIEAKYCDATPTTLKFTHESWDYIHQEAEKKYPELKIVGWIHTHPDFGIFLSEYDKFIQKNFFSESGQVAYVVDPIRNTEGFYFWIDGKITSCGGFYVFDRTGVSITVKEPAERQSGKEAPAPAGSSAVVYVLLVIMGIAVAVMMFLCLSMNSRIEVLQQQQKQSEEVQQQLTMHINQLYAEIGSLKSGDEETAENSKTESQKDAKTDNKKNSGN